MRRRAKSLAATDAPAFNPNEADDLWTKNPALIKDFLEARPEYEQLCTEVEYILKKKILAAGVEISAVGSRAKTLTSFLEKVKRKNYADPFGQIDDFAGVRVVCLYGNDIAKVISIIRSEFEIVEEVNKLEQLDSNKFGYIGHHFIVRLGENSSGARYDDLRTRRCEIQVRTVLQDAWAIIQHHMVYKKESQVPSPLIRKLNGLAGLLETADDQFEYIRSERDSYVETVRGSKSGKVEFLENELNIDSLVEYMQWRYPDKPKDEHNSASTIMFDILKGLNLHTLKDVDDLINRGNRFAKLVLPKFFELCSEQGIDVSDADSYITGPIHAAVALSADPELRAKFPWGETWISAMTAIDEG